MTAESTPYLLSAITGLITIITVIVGWFAVAVLKKGEDMEKTSSKRFEKVSGQISDLQSSTEKIKSDTTEYKKTLEILNVEVKKNAGKIKDVKFDLNDIKKKVKINEKEIKQIKYIRDQAEIMLKEK